MGVRVNLAGAEGFEPVPGGRYPLVVFDGEVRESGPEAKHPGAEYIAWTFKIASGDHEDRYIWDNTIISHDRLDEEGNFVGCDCGREEEIAKFNKGLFKIKELLAATEKWTPEELASDEFDFEIDDVIGSYVAGTLGIRTSDQYGDQNVIKRYKPVGTMEFADSSNLP